MSTTITEICSEIEPLLREKLFHPTFTTKAQIDGAVANFVAACSVRLRDDPVVVLTQPYPNCKVSNTAFWGDTERPLGAFGR